MLGRCGLDLEVPLDKYTRRRHFVFRWYIWIISQRGFTAIAIRFVASVVAALIIIAVATEVLLHTHAFKPTGVVSDKEMEYGRNGLGNEGRRGDAHGSAATS